MYWADSRPKTWLNQLKAVLVWRQFSELEMWTIVDFNTFSGTPKPWSHYTYGCHVISLLPHFPENLGLTAQYCSILQASDGLPNNIKGGG